MRRFRMSKKVVWMLSFEYEGVVKAGGLGAAVARYCRALAARGFSATVLIPSHGVRRQQRVESGWSGERRGVDGNTYPYSVGAETYIVDGVRVVSFRGLDQPTSRFLDSPEVYREPAEKASLYTRAVMHWAAEQPRLPDVVHSNDWTTALAGMALKMFSSERGAATPWVHTIHLLSSPSFPWHYASEQWSGLRSVLHRVVSAHGVYTTWVSDAWDSVGGNVDAFAALESDVLVSVSHGYAEGVVSRLGFVPREKVCVVYNSTDWELSRVDSWVRSVYGTGSRSALRPLVLRSLLAGLKSAEGSLDGCSLLVVSHGRLVWQKGFDTLLNALEHADPQVGVLILGLSSGDTAHEEYLKHLTQRYFGRAVVAREPVSPQLLQAVVYVANAAAVPSRYEPFGISSIEAQALGTPVVVSNVPGLSETVKNMEVDERGTALLVNPDDPRNLGQALTSVAWLTEAVDANQPALAGRAPLESVRRRFDRLRDVRMNAASWVDENFRERNTGEMLLHCYAKALQAALLRQSK
ncbi:MAG: glycogen/starch synthase [Candidatus Caldarchaeum sp.]